MMIQGQL